LEEVEIVGALKKVVGRLIYDRSEGVSKVPLYGTKFSTLKMQLIPKSGGRSTI